DDPFKEVIQAARRWVEQERVWDDVVYASPSSEGRREMGERRKLEPTNMPRPSSPPPRPARTPPLLPVRPSPLTPRSSSADVARKAAALQELYERYKDCTRCPLGMSRLKFVFGVGNPDAQVLFVGEGPGYEEDHRGEPFVGRA